MMNFSFTKLRITAAIANNPFSAEARCLVRERRCGSLANGGLAGRNCGRSCTLALDPSSSEIFEAFVYLRLKQGNHRGALLLLKQRRAPRPNQP